MLSDGIKARGSTNIEHIIAVVIFAWCTTGAVLGPLLASSTVHNLAGTGMQASTVSTQPLSCHPSTGCVAHSDSHKRRLRRRGFGSARRKHMEERSG